MKEENKILEQLKEEYMKVQPPEDGLKQLEQTIKRAKKDKRRTEKIHLFRNIAAGLAAVFAGMVVMANVNADFAYAMEKIPVIGNVIRVIAQEHFEAEEKYYTADIKTPQLEAEEDMAGVEKVNKAVKKDRDALIEQCKETFEKMAAEYHEGPKKEETSHYNITADYEIITDTEDYFVLRFWTVITSASAQQVEKYYTIDRKSGEMLELKDLFKADSDYVSVISKNIKSQMKQQMAEDDKVHYWLNEETTEWNFKEIRENQSFYINDKGELVISFDEFEVAPGYMGSVEFEIPKEALSLILK